MKRDLTVAEALSEAVRRWPIEKAKLFVRKGDGPPKDGGRAWRKLIEERNRGRKARATPEDWAAFVEKELERWIKSSIVNRCEVLVNRGWCCECRVWGPTFREGFERIDRQAAKDRAEAEKNSRIRKQRLDALAKAREARTAKADAARAARIANFEKDREQRDAQLAADAEKARQPCSDSECPCSGPGKP